MNAWNLFIGSGLASQLNQLKASYREEQKAMSELLHKLKLDQVSGEVSRSFLFHLLLLYLVTSLF